MKITSMSSRELLKTVTKSDFPGVSRENREILETGKLSDVSSTKTVNDRFESSDSVVFDGSLSVDGKKNTDRFEYSGNDDTDFNHLVDGVHNLDRSFSAMKQLSGGGMGVTKEAIARYYGGLARQLDEIYEKGKCTKEEYDCLNNDIAERMEHSTACAEDTAARRALLRRSMSPDYAKRAATMTKAEFEAEVQDYIEKHCKIDRKALMQMFNNVRYDKLRPKEKSFVIKTSSAAAENEKNTDIIDKV